MPPWIHHRPWVDCTADSCWHPAAAKAPVWTFQGDQAMGHWLPWRLCDVNRRSLQTEMPQCSASLAEIQDLPFSATLYVSHGILSCTVFSDPFHCIKLYYSKNIQTSQRKMNENRTGTCNNVEARCRLRCQVRQTDGAIVHGAAFYAATWGLPTVRAVARYCGPVISGSSDLQAAM